MENNKRPTMFTNGAWVDYGGNVYGGNVMENNKRPTQALMTLKYLQEHGSITSYEAMMELGIMSFPKRICELEKMGYLIKRNTEVVIDRYGKKTHVKRYSLIEEGAV